HAATHFGQIEIVRLLLQHHGVQRHRRKLYSHTAYEEAKTDEMREIFYRPSNVNRFCDNECVQKTFQIIPPQDQKLQKELNDKDDFIDSQWLTGIRNEDELLMLKKCFYNGSGRAIFLSSPFRCGAVWLIFACVLPYLMLAVAAAIALPMLLIKPTIETTQDTASTTSGAVTASVTASSTTSTTTTTISSNPCFAGTYWNVTGVTYAGNGTSGAALNQLSSPTGIFVTPNDTMYISDSGNWRIVAYLPNATSGSIVAGTGVGGSALTQLAINGIRYTYVDANQDIYISDSYNARVVRWASGGSTGVNIAGNNTGGSSLNQLNYPYGIWVDSSLNVFVSEYQNHRVTKWALGASAGVVVAGISGSSGSTTNLLSGPTGLYYDEANQNLYISNSNTGATVMKWQVGASNGTIMAGLAGSPGSSSSQLNTPTGIILDQWKNIYVNDRSNSRIQLFCNGNSTGITIAGSGTGGSSLSTPYDVKLDSQHNLYVVENAAHRVTKFFKL
ncbi:unnamed protein product, partial [Rotaria sp. Silwood1]